MYQIALPNCYFACDSYESLKGGIIFVFVKMRKYIKDFFNETWEDKPPSKFFHERYKELPYWAYKLMFLALESFAAFMLVRAIIIESL